jgi:exonuclease VII large subunit
MHCANHDGSSGNGPSAWTINLHASAHNKIQARQHALRLLEARLAAHHPSRELERRRALLVQLTARLRALGPQATLDRGYALVVDPQGHPLTRADKTKEGQPVRIFLSKGMVDANLDKAHPEKTVIDAVGSPVATEEGRQGTAVPTRKKGKARQKKA